MMPVWSKPDVIIAGGGVAGASVAAALQKFDYKVLIVEPGLDGTKRLAGELIHPPGIAALAELKLLSSLEGVGAEPVHGFAVMPCPYSAASRGSLSSENVSLLPYAELPGLKNQGLAMEHSVIRDRLLSACGRLPGVAILQGARITAVDLGEKTVTVSVSSGKRQETFRTSLFVAADGGSSTTRRLAGIREERTRMSTLVGYAVHDVELPHSGYGHVFLGEPGIALAYSVGAGKKRVLFDLPRGAERPKAYEHNSGWMKILPEPLGSAVRREMQRQRPLVSASYLTVPQSVTRGRMVLVGDAAGCCHPLTATGLTTCTRDALRVRDAIFEARGNIPEALRLYGNHRRVPEWTRLALATILYLTFREQTPEMRLLRDGLMRYWKADPKARAASMALLSTSEGRMTVMAQEFAKVMLYGLTSKRLSGEEKRIAFLGSRGRTAVLLSYRFLRSALKVLSAG